MYLFKHITAVTNATANTRTTIPVTIPIIEPIENTTKIMLSRKYIIIFGHIFFNLSQQ